VTLIGVPIAQNSFVKVSKGKVMNDTGNKQEVMIKVPRQDRGSRKKKRLKCDKS
jgi:hypothetical protein